MTQKPTEPKIFRIVFQYPCFICKEMFGTDVDVRSHIICLHHYHLPDMSSDAGKTRPPEDNVEFKELPESEEAAKDIMVHNACPSCWFHCPARDMLEFEVHILEAHNPCSIDDNEEQGEASTSAASPPQAKKQDKKKQVTQPTMKDIHEKLGDLLACMQAYIGRE